MKTQFCIKDPFAYSKMRKSQSAMEYLMTYGWAILIIAIVLVALFSLGIFNSSNFAPRAQPGSCEVLRNSAQTSLVGQCNGMLPEYVAQFSQTNISYVTATLPTQSGQNVTLSFWIDPVNLGTYGDNCNTDNHWQMIFQNTGSSFYVILETCGSANDPNPNLDWNIGNSRISLYMTGKKLTANIWQNIVVVFNGTFMTIYLNGLPVVGPTSSNGSKISPYTSIQISSSSPLPNIGDNPISGSVSNFQLYNASLSNSSIEALYKEGIGGAPIDVNNLIGWWPLNGNANDYSGNDNNGVPINVTYTSSWTSSYSAP